MTLNELVKLTTLWTTGPSLETQLTLIIQSEGDQQISITFEYCIYCKYSDSSTPYHTFTICYPMLCLKIAWWAANSVDPDETLHSAGSHLGLHCLLSPVCPNTYSCKSFQKCCQFQCVITEALLMGSHSICFFGVRKITCRCPVLSGLFWVHF